MAGEEAEKPKPEAPVPEPVGAGVPAAPAAPKVSAAAAKNVGKVYPPRKFNDKNGRLLHGTRYWPTEKWANPWGDPGYRAAAAILAFLVVAPFALGGAVGELSALVGKAYDFAAQFAAKQGIPERSLVGAWALLKVLVVLHIILLNGLFAIWWERKISAHMQSRLGPMETGGWHGWAQTIADGVKLFLKEDTTPESADRWVHRLAPAVAVVPAIIAFAPVLFGEGLSAAPLDTGVLYIFAIAGVSVIGIVMAGWGSGNKYSLLGALRSAAQLVSYELPRTFSVVPVIMLAGSLSLVAIEDAQAGYWLGLVPKWFIFYPVVGQIAFAIFLIASVAETNRTPFDVPEAESELVAGFHTEYSGMKWSIFFLAEYAYVLLASFLTATFFFGGGAAPMPFLSVVPSWIWFLAKALFFMFCFLWFRWTFPRFRVDRLMDFCWKFLLPWSFANIAFAGAYLYLPMSGYFGRIWSAFWNTCKGLAITFRYLWKPAVTVQYPNEKLVPYDLFRGALLFDANTCIACNLCVKACPSLCIALENSVNPQGKKVAKVDWYSIDFGKCNFCRLCEESCPTKPKSVWHSLDYELTFSNRDEMTRCWRQGDGWVGLYFDRKQNAFLPPPGQTSIHEVEPRR